MEDFDKKLCLWIERALGFLDVCLTEARTAPACLSHHTGSHRPYSKVQISALFAKWGVALQCASVKHVLSLSIGNGPHVCSQDVRLDSSASRKTNPLTPWLFLYVKNELSLLWGNYSKKQESKRFNKRHVSMCLYDVYVGVCDCMHILT